MRKRRRRRGYPRAHVAASTAADASAYASAAGTASGSANASGSATACAAGFSTFRASYPRADLAAAICFARPRALRPWAGAVHSEAGEIPALSRNGDARLVAAVDEPGRLVCANDLSSEEGRLGPTRYWRRSETHFVLLQ